MLSKISYYSILALLITIPLAFTTYLENIFDLTKITALKLIGGVFIISTCLLLYRKSRPKNTKSPDLIFDRDIDPCVLFFLFAALLSTIFSTNPFVSYNGQYMRQFGFIAYLYIYFIYIFSSAIFKEGKNIHRSLTVMEICGIIIAVYSIIQFAGLDVFHLQPKDNHRLVSTMGHGILTAGFLVLIFPFSFSRLFRGKLLDWKSLIPLLLLAAVIITQTRTAYVALLAEIILMLVLYPFAFGTRKGQTMSPQSRVLGISGKRNLLRISIPVIVLLLTVIVLAIIVAHDNIYVQRLLSIFNLTDTPRWTLWKDSFKVFKNYPVAGSGIGTFSNVFEDVYSGNFKMLDVRRLYDNAHNNFINIACTMGIIGLTAYLLLLYRLLFVSCRTLFSDKSDNAQKYFSLSFLPVICGYIIYGLADFDNIAIWLYLLILIAMMKTFDLPARSAGGREAKSKRSEDPPQAGNPNFLNRFANNVVTRQSLAFLLSAYLIYNCYEAIILFKADGHFKTANEFYKSGNFKGAYTSLTDAENLNPSCSDYRFRRGYLILNSVVNDTTLSKPQRQNLLEQAAKEFEAAEQNSSSRKTCREALCLAYYEMGRMQEGDRLRDEILLKDSISVDLRNNLSRQYMRFKQFDKALRQIEFLNRYDPQNVEANLTSVSYYMLTGDYKKAESICDHVLQIDPDNKIAKSLLQKMKN